MALCVKEHDALIAEVGSAAQSLVDHRGWLNCCRTEKTLLKGIADAQTLEEYGVDCTVLAGAQLREVERKRSVSGPAQAAARVASRGCQFQGRSSAMRRAGWSAMRASTSAR